MGLGTRIVRGIRWLVGRSDEAAETAREAERLADMAKAADKAADVATVRRAAAIASKMPRLEKARQVADEAGRQALGKFVRYINDARIRSSNALLNFNNEKVIAEITEAVETAAKARGATPAEIVEAGSVAHETATEALRRASNIARERVSRGSTLPPSEVVLAQQGKILKESSNQAVASLERSIDSEIAAVGVAVAVPAVNNQEKGVTTSDVVWGAIDGAGYLADALGGPASLAGGLALDAAINAGTKPETIEAFKNAQMPSLSQIKDGSKNTVKAFEEIGKMGAKASDHNTWGVPSVGGF
ncbi:MAG: hypothetical protein R3F23_07895 [Verrucomicrobiia bacterium]